MYDSIEVNRSVVSLYFNVQNGWEQRFLFTSDNHHDSIYCNREVERQHLEEAHATGALVVNTGDLFDAMQGRHDPRRAYKELREEFRVENYYDAIVDDAADFYAPYANDIVLLARGNHETSCLKNANTDLTDRLTRELNRRTGSTIVPGGYGGWIRLMFNLSGGQNTGPRTSLKIKYFHGAGGDAPVTRGVIHTNRQAVYLPDAAVVVNGHNHNAYYVPISRERLSNKGVPYIDTQHHIRVPGYKQEYADGSGGWSVERGGVPKPIGAAWLHLWCERGMIRSRVSMDILSPQAIEPVLMQEGDYAEVYYEEDASEGDV